MNKVRYLLFISGVISILWIIYPTKSASNNELTAKEIVMKTDGILRGKQSKTLVEMKIFTPGWQRTLKIRSWHKGLEKAFVRIISPPKEAGITSLKIEDKIWNYLPNVEMVMRISPSMLMQSWMGSDFTYDDIVKDSSLVEDYTHTLLGIEYHNNIEVYKIEFKPKPNAPVVWGKIIALIRKDNFLPIQQSYFDERGELIRILKYSEFKWMDDRLYPTFLEMLPMTKEGHKTTVKYLEVLFTKDVDEGIFSLQTLKRDQGGF